MQMRFTALGLTYIHIHVDMYANELGNTMEAETLVHCAYLQTLPLITISMFVFM